VVVTRPEAGELAAALERAGFEVAHVPLIAVEPPDDGGAALAGALSRLGGFEWLVVTSANGARAVGAAAAAAPAVRLAAVGAATARVLEGLAGRAVDLVARDQRAAGLLAELPDVAGSVLVAQADRASGEVVAGLRDRGVDVEAVTAYRTVARAPSAGELEWLRTADAIVLASPSAAESLRAATSIDPATRLVAIGPTTAAAVRAFGLPVTTSASPSLGDIAAAVAAALDGQSGRSQRVDSVIAPDSTS